MTSVIVMPSVVSIREPKPSTTFATVQYPPLKSGIYEILTRAALPTLPRNSIIVSAKYKFTQYQDYSGSNTISIKRNLATWKWSVTWNQRPSVAVGATDTVTKSGSTSGTVWEFDVTDDVQDFYDNTKTNWGWTLRTDSSTTEFIRGRKAADRQPYLVIEYEPPAKVPTDLSPAGGAVSVAKPVLTFDTSDNTISIQVQIDAAADAISPDFDSGEIASTGGKLDLSATAYAGLSDGSTTYWRARAKSAAGWSSWSPWVDFSRQDLDAVTLTAPASTTADTSPPFAWTFGGTQTAWRADLMYGSKILRSSGLRSGADDDWTPDPLSGAYFGKTLTARVRVFDDVTRIATPGAHTYSEDTADFVASFTGTVDPMDTLTATQDVAGSPGITLAGTRAAGIPDEVAIFHDDELVARIDGADAFTSSTAFEFTDWWARMGEETVITVVPVVNGDFADDSPTVTLTPRCRGLWLIEPASGAAIVLWGTDDGAEEQGDLATVATTTDGRFVRRRLANAPRAGSYSGDVIDAAGFAADDTLDAFDTFRDNDASTVYRLVRGKENRAVIAGDFIDFPTSMENLDDEVFSRGQFSWWDAVEPVVVDGG